MDNLREIRKGKHISQEQLAEVLGTTQAAISQWEQGRSTPRFKTLMKLCEVLECSVDDLTKKGA